MFMLKMESNEGTNDSPLTPEAKEQTDATVASLWPLSFGKVQGPNVP